MLLLVVRPICKKRCFKWAAAAALDRGYIYLYKSLSKSFEANSFPISWQKGFALYVEIYIHTDLSPCVSFGLFSSVYRYISVAVAYHLGQSAQRI
jgi:hypothetical protein